VGGYYPIRSVSIGSGDFDPAEQHCFDEFKGRLPIYHNAAEMDAAIREGTTFYYFYYLNTVYFIVGDLTHYLPVRIPYAENCEQADCLNKSTVMYYDTLAGEEKEERKRNTTYTSPVQVLEATTIVATW